MAHPAETEMLSNWSETCWFSADSLRECSTEEEVIKVVTAAEHVRVAGSMHSCAPLIESEEIIVSLKKMNKILSIHPETMKVRIQAGVVVHELCAELAKCDPPLALGTLGTIDWQVSSHSLRRACMHRVRETVR